MSLSGTKKRVEYLGSTGNLVENLYFKLTSDGGNSKVASP